MQRNQGVVFWSIEGVKEENSKLMKTCHIASKEFLDAAVAQSHQDGVSTWINCPSDHLLTV